MKMTGVIVGQTIVLDAPTNLPDGQTVQVDVEIATAEPGGPIPQLGATANEVTGSGDQAPSDHLRATDAFRQRIAERWRGRVDRSVGDIREDRER